MYETVRASLPPWCLPSVCGIPFRRPNTDSCLSIQPQLQAANAWLSYRALPGWAVNLILCKWISGWKNDSRQLSERKKNASTAPVAAGESENNIAGYM